MAGRQTHGAVERHREIERQLAAMGVDRYVVGVHHRAEARMWRLANLTAQQVLEHERAFASLNLRGRDLYIAPVRNGGLILVDDLPETTLQRMRQDGLEPALSVETSPANYQAWVRLASESLPRELATAVSRELAVRYGGDRGSVGSEHMGRLAGYTNQKPSRTQPDGRQPWVRMHEAEGRRASAADRLLAEVRAQLAVERPLPPRASGTAEDTRLWQSLDTHPLREGAGGLPLTAEYLAQEFAVRAARVLERQAERGGRLDYSAADWAVVGTLSTRYPWISLAQLAEAMRAGSPNLEQRHQGHVADYVGRTVTKAVRVLQAEQARDGPADPSRDHEKGDRAFAR
ncbi:MAG TPA: DNA-primase RepB domain-containing protein [Chloroflexota bacterium]|nr:DNA-primase RepB domain-containing protein [Chloroflexota bacterium]